MNSTESQDRKNDRTIGRRKDDFRIREQNQRYKRLLSVGQAITSEMRMADLFEAIMEETNKIMGTQRSTVFLHDEGTRELWSMVATGIGKNEIRIRSDNGVVGWVFHQRQTLIVNDAYNDSRFCDIVDQSSGFLTKNIICSPLIDKKGKTIGALQSLNKGSGDFVEDDKRIFISIANYVAIALENSRLYENLKDYAVTVESARKDEQASRIRAEHAESQTREYASRLEEMVEERTRELREAQAKLMESEKRTLEHRITGGFAHEMRNALAGVQLEFKTTLDYKNQGKPSAAILKESATTLLKNISQLHEEYQIPREKIATLLLPELKTIAEIADHLKEVHAGVSSDLDRGLSITTQIRDYARMSEFKKGEADVDIVSVFRSYGDRYQQDFERIGISYLVEGLESAMVKSDEIHINSIFSNLILNAKDALEELNTDRAKEIRVSVEEQAGSAQQGFVITVSDNGPGIPEDKLKEIFEPFYSTKPTTGTGLGLGIVKRLVQLYNGTIFVQSERADYTTFKVTLPVELN